MLVNITLPNYRVQHDIAYATPNNFTGSAVYQRPACFLHADAAACLTKAIECIESLLLQLVIFDAFRPTEAQQLLWNHTPDPHFLADPKRGSPHSRGVAVDVTLANSEGERLDMGTVFDDFTPRSHHGDLTISVQAQKNRLLLLGIMTQSGFDFYHREWWHYQLHNSRDYPLLSDHDAGTHMM